MACCDVIVLISFPGPSLSGETQNRLSSPICFSVLFSQMLAGLDQGLLFLLSPCVSLVVFFPCSLGGFLNCGSDPAGLWGCGVWGGCGGVMWGLLGVTRCTSTFPLSSFPGPAPLFFISSTFVRCSLRYCQLPTRVALPKSGVWEIFFLPPSQHSVSSSLFRDPCVKHLSWAGCSGYEGGHWPSCLLSWKGRQIHVVMEMGQG